MRYEVVEKNVVLMSFDGNKGDYRVLRRVTVLCRILIFSLPADNNDDNGRQMIEIYHDSPLLVL